MRRAVNIRITVVLNRLLLIALSRIMRAYRHQSAKLISALDGDTLWVSGIQDEERLLDRTQTIIERRIKASERNVKKSG